MVVSTLVIASVLGFFGVIIIVGLALTPSRERFDVLQSLAAVIYFPVRQPVLMLTQNQVLATILQVLWWLALWVSAALIALKKARSPLAIGAHFYVIAGVALYFAVAW